MKVLLIDDHDLFRSGMKALLEGLLQDVTVILGPDCSFAVDYEDKAGVDLVLLDLNLEGTSGFDALELVKQHYHCSVVAISSEDDPRIIRQTISNGAAGFIPKSSSPEVLVAAMQLVVANGIYLPPHVLNDYENKRVSGAGDHDDARKEILGQLTARQYDVLIKAAQGKSNKVIAREMNIAEGTVKAHLSACYRVLEVDNRTEAVYATASLGLFPEGEISRDA